MNKNNISLVAIQRRYNKLLKECDKLNKVKLEREQSFYLIEGQAKYSNVVFDNLKTSSEGV